MKYFKMSRNFNKKNPKEFGFIIKDNKIILPLDHSVWEIKQLYDFGWGKENGFYKTPLPNFNELIDIILKENDEDDIYGAAAIILELYSKELLLYLESLGIPSQEIKGKLNKVFQLQKPINRSFEMRMSVEEISKEHMKWINISKRFQ